MTKAGRKIAKGLVGKERDDIIQLCDEIDDMMKKLEEFRTLYVELLHFYHVPVLVCLMTSLLYVTDLTCTRSILVSISNMYSSVKYIKVSWCFIP